MNSIPEIQEQLELLVSNLKDREYSQSCAEFQIRHNSGFCIYLEAKTTGIDHYEFIHGDTPEETFINAKTRVEEKFPSIKELKRQEIIKTTAKLTELLQDADLPEMDTWVAQFQQALQGLSQGAIEHNA